MTCYDKTMNREHVSKVIDEQREKRKARRGVRTGDDNATADHLVAIREAIVDGEVEEALHYIDRLLKKHDSAWRNR